MANNPELKEKKVSSGDSATGKRIVQARNDAGLKQNKLAELLGIRPSLLSKYEAGRFPPRNIIVEVSKITKVSLDWLLTGEGARGLALKEKVAEYRPQPTAEDLNRAAQDRLTPEEYDELAAFAKIYRRLSVEDRHRVLVFASGLLPPFPPADEKDGP